MIRILFAFAFVIGFLTPDFSFATGVKHVFTAKINQGASAAQTFGNSTAAVNQVLQCSGTTSAGSGSATIKLQGSNDNSNWVDLGTCSLTLGTSITTSSATNTANWYWYRVNVTAISGTNASIDAWLSY